MNRIAVLIFIAIISSEQVHSSENEDRHRWLDNVASALVSPLRDVAHSLTNSAETLLVLTPELPTLVQSPSFMAGAAGAVFEYGMPIIVWNMLGRIYGRPSDSFEYFSRLSPSEKAFLIIASWSQLASGHLIQKTMEFCNPIRHLMDLDWGTKPHQRTSFHP